MKKNYIQPLIIASLPYEMEKPICESIDPVVNSKWGNRFSNEGPYADPEKATNDNGFINSQTKSRGSDWGSIW